jgi:ribosome-associated protein
MGENIERMSLNSKVEPAGAAWVAQASLEVRGGLRVPLSEVKVRFSRSSGPGGQNVNKTSTRVELRFNVLRSAALSDAEKERITSTLAARIDGAGWLRIVEQRSRSQTRNRELALQKLRDLLRSGLRKPRSRVPTRPSRAAQEKRIQAKKRKSETKRWRGRVEG